MNELHFHTIVTVRYKNGNFPFSAPRKPGSQPQRFHRVQDFSHLACPANIVNDEAVDVACGGHHHRV